MPRISKFSVKFPVGEQTYIAHFSHHHSQKRGDLCEHRTEKVVNIVEPNPNRQIATPVRHVTRCRIFKVGPGYTGVAEGSAACSFRDTYDWRKGVKLSFIRAIAGHISTSDEIVNKFLAGFYQELKIRAPERALDRTQAQETAPRELTV